MLEPDLIIKTSEKYLTILKTCRFVAKSDESFIKGTECKLGQTYLIYDDVAKDKFNDGLGLF